MAKKKNPHAQAMAKLGAKKAAAARMEKITPERRSEIARKAVMTRWAKAKKARKENG